VREEIVDLAAQESMNQGEPHAEILRNPKLQHLQYCLLSGGIREEVRG
jgi:hypothetical protein